MVEAYGIGRRIDRNVVMPFLSPHIAAQIFDQASADSKLMIFLINEQQRYMRFIPQADHSHHFAVIIRAKKLVCTHHEHSVEHGIRDEILKALNALCCVIIGLIPHKGTPCQRHGIIPLFTICRSYHDSDRL